MSIFLNLRSQIYHQHLNLNYSWSDNSGIVMQYWHFTTSKQKMIFHNQKTSFKKWNPYALFRLLDSP